MDLDVVTVRHDLPKNRRNLFTDVLARVKLIKRLHSVVSERRVRRRLYDSRVQDLLHRAHIWEVRPAFQEELRRARVLTARAVQLHRKFLILLHRLID